MFYLIYWRVCRLYLWYGIINRHHTGGINLPLKTWIFPQLLESFFHFFVILAQILSPERLLEKCFYFLFDEWKCTLTNFNWSFWRHFFLSVLGFLNKIFCKICAQQLTKVTIFIHNSMCFILLKWENLLVFFYPLSVYNKCGKEQ